MNHPRPQPSAGDEKTAGETFTRGGQALSLIEEFAAETLGSLSIDPRWFDLGDDWETSGNTVTAPVRIYQEDGTLAPERYRVTLTVEPIAQEQHPDDDQPS